MQREERAGVGHKLITELEFLEGTGRGENKKLSVQRVGKFWRTTDYSLHKT